MNAKMLIETKTVGHIFSFLSVVRPTMHCESSSEMKLNVISQAVKIDKDFDYEK